MGVWWWPWAGGTGPVPGGNAQPPMPPANAPIPTTEPTAARGNMSLASVYTLADHAWCAAAATPTIRTAVHMLPASGAKAVGTIRRAVASIAVLRAPLTGQPRLRSEERRVGKEGRS